MKIRAIVVVQPCPYFHISERTATYIIKVSSANYTNEERMSKATR